MFARTLFGGGEAPDRVSLVGSMAKRGCAAHDGPSCRWVGYVARLQRQDDTAIEAYAAGCRLHDALACVEHATLALCGRGDFAACRAELIPFCSAEMGNGCAMLARMSREGRSTGTPDLTDALALARRGCDAGAGDACSEAAEVVTLQKASGWEVNRKRLLERGCDEGGHPLACLRAGLVHLSDAKIDSERVMSEFDRACRGASADGCGYYAMLALGLTDTPVKKPDVVLAIDRAATGCERGSAVACWVDGRVWERGARGRAASNDEAARRYDFACASQPPFGCADGARLLSAGLVESPTGSEAIARARTMLTAGCDLGKDKDSCAALEKLPKASSFGAKEKK